MMQKYVHVFSQNSNLVKINTQIILDIIKIEGLDYHK